MQFELGHKPKTNMVHSELYTCMTAILQAESCLAPSCRDKRGKDVGSMLGMAVAGMRTERTNDGSATMGVMTLLVMIEMI